MFIKEKLKDKSGMNADSPNEDGKINIYYEREIWNTI